jgi:aerobic carbon-monoxide dehydrogenase large subunit
MQRTFPPEVVYKEETKRSKYIGESIKKQESLSFLRGKGKYIDDVRLPTKVLHVGFLRSPYAHARIKRIDSRRALEIEGVRHVFTGEDFARFTLGYWMHFPGMAEPVRHPLAVGKVKFEGEPLAAVVAASPRIVEDALESIDVEYEPLQAVVDPLGAADAKAIIHEDLPDNVLFRRKYRSNDRVLETIDSSDLIIETQFRNGRTSPLSLETRGGVAWFDGERFTIWASTQIPHHLRTFVAETFGFPENKIHVIAPDVGGGFGPKSSVFQDEVALYAIALELKVPVKWIASRTEDIQMCGHERDQVHFAKAGFTKQGKLVGIHDRIVADLGIGGTFLIEVRPVMVTSTTLPGPYEFRNYSYEIEGVVTNKAPWAPNIGFGRPVGVFVMELLMDQAASKLGLDPTEIRRRNLVKDDAFPYRNPAGMVYDSGRYGLGFDTLLKGMKYDQLREWQNRLLKSGRHVGIGLSAYVEFAGPSSAINQNLGWEIGGLEKAVVKIDATGKITVGLGVADQGQGHRTIFAQIAAQELGADIADVKVIEGDTDSTPYGRGTWASRSTILAGNAIVVASRKLNSKLRRIAAYILGVRIEDIDIDMSTAYDKRSEKKITFAEIGKIAYRFTTKLPPGEQPDLEEVGIFDSPSETNVVSYGCHGACVEIDPETGRVQVKSYFVVDDAGVIVNPVSAEGQIHGAVVGQGFLQTFSELQYDKEGVLKTSTLMDYGLPTAQDLPYTFSIEKVETPSLTPGGFKGLGEGGAVGSPAALINAINDAIRPLGKQISKVPISPNEIWEQLEDDR